MTYPVRLEVFEGPLDLLLHLVSRERLNVADISVSTITDEYLRALRSMDDVDLDLASSFLVLAATLLELKSIKLLPGTSLDDPEISALLEERDHLLHRLIEYSTFKKASLVISTGLERGRGYFPRIADIPAELLPSAPDLLEGVTVKQLAAVGAGVLAPKIRPPVDTSYIAPIRVSVREMIDLLSEQIRLRGTASFRDLCREATARIEVIVRFLALLELFRTEDVDLEQSRPFDDILIRWREPKVGRQE